jgi:hypothetical protein
VPEGFDRHVDRWIAGAKRRELSGELPGGNGLEQPEQVEGVLVSDAVLGVEALADL